MVCVGASVLACVALGFGIEVGQPMPTHYRSVEAMALTGASMVGTAVRIQPPAPGGEQYKVCVVFRDVQTINWHGAYPETGAFLSVSKSTVQQWIDSKARILSFDGGDWINLDDPKTKVFDADLNRIQGVDAVVSRLRLVYHQHPEIERGRIYYRPFLDDEVQRLGVESDARFGVLCDRKLEQWAIRCLTSTDWVHRVEGTRALRWFRSKDNEERLLKLLLDPFEVKVEGEKSRYPVRDAAREVLLSWKGIVPS